ncbi:hypothetical protein GCM10023189_31040 [Nibrella saemangeumensis]|uniref:Uncharacterized protein n=1 Tax=Nibrella saemangeumensis TaxID=1084526 RepID=A0ABP8N200_9BACT
MKTLFILIFLFLPKLTIKAQPVRIKNVPVRKIKLDSLEQARNAHLYQFIDRLFGPDSLVLMQPDTFCYYVEQPADFPVVRFGNPAEVHIRYFSSILRQNCQSWQSPCDQHCLKAIPFRYIRRSNKRLYQGIIDSKSFWTEPVAQTAFVVYNTCQDNEVTTVVLFQPYTHKLAYMGGAWEDDNQKKR